MTTSTAPAGTTRDWEAARRLRDELHGIRSDEAEKSVEMDAVIGRLAKAGNSGYTIAKELGMERPTIARMLKRVTAKPKKKPKKKTKAKA